MVIFNILNEFDGDHFWLKTFVPWGALGGNLKISSGKISLVAYHCKNLFKTSILIKKISPAIIRKGDTGYDKSTFIFKILNEKVVLLTFHCKYVLKHSK